MVRQVGGDWAGSAAVQTGLDLATDLVVSDPGPRAARVLAVPLKSVPVSRRVGSVRSGCALAGG